MSKVLVVHSGGLDSTVVLAMALNSNVEVETVSFSYGSKHEKMELGAALHIADYYEVSNTCVVVPQIFGEQSALLFGGKIPMPHQTYKEIREMEGPSQTVVPFRNGVFLAMAVALAAGKGFDEVHVGMHAEDAHNSAYPDCRFDFVGAFSAAAYIGTYHKIKIVAPLINMQKSDVVWCGNKLDVPFHLTRSCYDPVGELACGLCPTCIERIHAFKVCGLVDPILYVLHQEADMTIIIYDENHPNPNPLSDADGHIFHDDGRVTPIYHESRLHGCVIGMEPVPDYPGYYMGGPK